ncbi:M48 family metallopeptidase [Spirochaeta isovalerica]|uniref:STE24 endopeptidase n=1 Tax=Spirochaeta isovalerica TaxID=150 RepID=A0A841R633_9SPIO|nr:M48 family metallopeptidase [Spirochaeta isovalerica]MBB6478617.1 STE24 endopeptidase [Spirochaeta isovalerica]
MNLNSSLANRYSVPPYISHVMSIRKYEKTIDYTQRKGKYSLFSSTVATSLTALVIWYQIPARILGIIQGSGLHPYAEGVLYLLLLTGLSSLISLPLTLYSQFVIEEEFGFNKMTFRLYLSDMVKNGILSLVLFVPLLLGLFLFMDKSGSLWWLYTYLFFTAFQLVISLLYPLVIAPIFNKFTELEEGELKNRLFALAERTSFKTSGIFIMDGSRRSAHSNAYFTGFGKARRIVLFDTLLKQLSHEELEAVLAHEIGHFKKKHILKRLVFSLISAFALFYGLSILLDFTPLYEAFGFKENTLPALLVILSFVTGPISFFIKPVFSLFSRKDEYEADRFAALTLKNGKPLIDALIVLGKENLSNLTPHKIYSAFHYSHPVLSERISALERYK